MWVSPGQQVTHVGLLLQGQVAGGGVSFDPCCLEDFEMMQVLGTGSFGRVTLAKHRESETVCAVKALSKAHMLKNQQVSSRKANRCKHSTALHLWSASHASRQHIAMQLPLNQSVCNAEICTC